MQTVVRISRFTLVFVFEYLIYMNRTWQRERLVFDEVWNKHHNKTEEVK